jgi:hypothetical protein
MGWQGGIPLVGFRVVLAWIGREVYRWWGLGWFWHGLAGRYTAGGFSSVQVLALVCGAGWSRVWLRRGGVGWGEAEMGWSGVIVVLAWVGKFWFPAGFEAS